MLKFPDWFVCISEFLFVLDLDQALSIFNVVDKGVDLNVVALVENDLFRRDKLNDHDTKHVLHESLALCLSHPLEVLSHHIV